MRDKTKDERYWILTLFAIAKELERRAEIQAPMVEADLAVGLPPEHYALRQRFADYFKRGRVNFVLQRCSDLPADPACVRLSPGLRRCCAAGGAPEGDSAHLHH